MKLYLDTNIYDLIARHNKARETRTFLDQAGHYAEASNDHLTEAARIPDDIQRIEVQNAIVTVSASFEAKPQSWLHAQEVRREIMRCRPGWLRPRPSRELIRVANNFLKGQQELWEEARHFVPTPSSERRQFESDLSRGIGEEKEAQKVLRTARLSKPGPIDLYSVRGAKRELLAQSITEDIETYWRSMCLIVWYRAIAQRNPSSRDYADWLLPYIRDDVFDDPSYNKFWLTDVLPERVPLNRLIAILSYYQTDHKVTAGNALDQIHAGHLLSCDALITADRAFFDSLQHTVKLHFAHTGRPILIDGSTSDVLVEMAQALR